MPYTYAEICEVNNSRILNFARFKLVFWICKKHFFEENNNCLKHYLIISLQAICLFLFSLYKDLLAKKNRLKKFCEIWNSRGINFTQLFLTQISNYANLKLNKIYNLNQKQ